jgi:hypothetical protein
MPCSDLKVKGFGIDHPIRFSSKRHTPMGPSTLAQLELKNLACAHFQARAKVESGKPTGSLEMPASQTSLAYLTLAATARGATGSPYIMSLVDNELPPACGVKQEAPLL